MDLAETEKIKRLTIVGLFADDALMDSLVLKGGNALDIIYGVAPRASIDIDLSMPDEFKQGELDTIKERMEKSLGRVFNENGYEIFDVTLAEKPENKGPKVPLFWGGYQLKFKLLAKGTLGSARCNLETLRRNAEVVGPKNLKTFRVDISKFEYCQEKDAKEINGYLVYVYTPAMIAIEKLRAICQQTEEYREVIGKSHVDARARDFFDIYTVIEHFGVNLTTPNNRELLIHVFNAKHVPIALLTTIAKHREFHRPDFSTVTDALKPGVSTRDFDFYFDYVVEKCDALTQALGIEKAPLT